MHDDISEYWCHPSGFQLVNQPAGGGGKETIRIGAGAQRRSQIGRKYLPIACRLSQCDQ